jgi:hypothetical protein
LIEIKRYASGSAKSVPEPSGARGGLEAEAMAAVVKDKSDGVGAGSGHE